jgi:cytochrome c peroxidase
MRSRAGLIALMLAACAWAVAVVAAVQEPAHIHHAPAQARMLTSPLELTEADVAAGAEAFKSRCASCHGADGKGPLLWQNGKPKPADLTDPRMREHVDGEIYWVVTNGITESGMPASATHLGERARWQVTAYVRTLAGIKLALSTPGAGGSYVWDLPPGFPRPKVPADNPMTEAKVELGRHLFYDTRLSVDNTFACSSCHQQERAFADDKARGVGVTGEVHPRGSMSLTNIAYSPVLTWANPTQRKLETQALVPMFGEEPVELGLSGKEKDMLARLAAVPKYRELFAAAFPGEADPINLANVTKGIASFERVLVSGRSPYDRYRTGEDPIAISDSAKRGEALFFSETTECFHCHGGFNFTETADYIGKGFLEIEFHNTGLYNIDGKGAYPAPNTGVMAVSDDEEDMGRFKAPSLRNIAETAPYMHDGSIATLEEVIAHYEAGGRTIASGPNAGDGSKSPLKSSFVKGFTLTPQERKDLVAFLKNLTDEEFLTDPRFANPWKK